MFQPNWVLRGQLLLGSAPLYVHHLQLLKSVNIVSILALCSESEAPMPFALAHRFEFRRFILPDHQSRAVPSAAQIQEAYLLLLKLLESGPVYVHCLAGVERSPLLCLAWLMVFRRLPLLDALSYLKSIHPSTDPLPEQLSSLRLWYSTYYSSSSPPGFQSQLSY